MIDTYILKKDYLAITKRIPTTIPKGSEFISTRNKQYFYVDKPIRWVFHALSVVGNEEWFEKKNHENTFIDKRSQLLGKKPEVY